MLNETHIRVFLGTPNVFIWALSLGGFHKHTSVKNFLSERNACYLKTFQISTQASCGALE